MDMSSALWLSELEMDDPIVRHQQSLMSVLDHETASFNPTYSSESYSAYGNKSMMSNPNDTPINSFQSEMDVIMKPAKMPKTINVNSSTTKSAIPKRPGSASSSAIISFEKADSTPIHWDDKKLTYLMKPTKKENFLDTNFGDEGDFSYSYNSNGSLYHGLEISRENITSLPVKRTPLQAQDHVLAERKRRERITQRFIALSSLVPGLKKMDKASVLEDATKYIKHLQERVKTLEEKTVMISNAKNQGVVSLKRSRMCLEEESSSSNEDSRDYCPRESFPEIEVRMSEGNVLFRVQSKNIPGLAVNLFSKIEKLHMTIISSSVMPFSNSSLLITVISQRDAEFRMSANDLVKSLQLSILELRSN